MNFNFKEILEMFSGHWKFLALLVLVSALVGAFVIVPLGQARLGSDRNNCSAVLDENEKLIHRMVRISAVVREYSHAVAAQENVNRSVSEMVIERAATNDTVQPEPILAAGEANEYLNLKKEIFIKQIEELADVNN